MESLIKLQIDTQKAIERGKINFKKSPKDRITQGYIETRLETLEDQWRRFNDTHTKIIQQATIEQMKGSYFTSNIYDSTEETYIIYKSDLKDSKLKFVEKDNCEQGSSKVKKSSNIKLPKINIPTFSGKYEEWISFRDLFTSLVHKNETLDDVQKLHYLKGLLTGEAEQLLRQNSITEANYDVCWAKLDQRYNNKRRLANNILQRLFDQKRMGTESASGLRHLLDTTADCMSALTNLGIDVTTWDIIVIYIVTAKLDQDTRKQWELTVSADSSNDLPTLDQFQVFIESRFRAFENIEPRRVAEQSHGLHKEKKVLLATNKTASSNYMRCEFCSDNHKLCFCKGFLALDIGRKRQFVVDNKICFNCLGSNHIVSQCKKNTSCKFCRRRHHSLLHVHEVGTGRAETTGNSSNDTKSSDVSVPVVSCLSTKIAQPRQVLLATALIKAQTAMGNFQIVRALLDQGSQASFITEAAVQFLRLKKSPIRGVVSGIGNEKTSIANYMVTLVLRSLTETDFELTIKAYVLKKITSYLPERQLEPVSWPDLEHLVLADPNYSTPNRIDVLLGADVYSNILQDGVKRAPNGSFVAQRTNLGWILSGSAHLKSKVESSNLTAMHIKIEENDFLKRFWEIEDQMPNVKNILTQEEQSCEEFFASTTSRTVDGRYVVRLPFKDQHPACVGGNSREIALKRFKLLERKFNKDKELKEKYTKVIKEYLQLNHMVEVDDMKIDSNQATYLPHHAVIREDKSTTKLRVVFDASCKNENGVSLNDTLMVGPTLQSDLRHIVLRWRTHKIAIVADIVKMYRQVRVAEEDTKYQRILWRDKPGDEIRDYSLKTVTFGTASAPYLAVKALHQVAIDHGEQYPAAAERVPSSYYMDDMMVSCATVGEGKRLCREMTDLLGKAGFELQKWNSNSSEILEEMTQSDDNKDKDRTERDVNSSKEVQIVESTKILGLTWCRGADEFRYTVQLHSISGKVTKRNIISDIARLFDPLGWLAPSIILAKILIQNFWRRWSTEYLSTLVQRYKWSSQRPEPKVGDVVLVKETDLSPACWLLGRIVEKHPGSDNITRVVTLRVKGNLLKRPTSKLCILPVSE